MSEDQSFTPYPSYTDKNTRKSHFVAIFFIILLVVVLILVGLYFLGASKKGNFNPLTPAKSASVHPTDSVKQTPTSTPTPPALERADLSIVVLNGSGVAGAAGKTSTKLKDLGYTVESTGNAGQFDYKGITVVIKEAKKEYVDMLKKDLKDEDSSIDVKFDEKIKADAEVIVGK